MRRRFNTVLVGALAVCACAAPMVDSQVPARAEAAVATEQKTVFIIRHLQKAQGDDPSLTAEGAAAAQRLADMLEGKAIAAIFATPTRRAMETASPLAARLGIPVTPYDPRNPGALVEAAASAPGPVLVVGHSNTVHDLVGRFGGSPPAPLSEEDYGTIFVVEPDGEVARLDVR